MPENLLPLTHNITKDILNERHKAFVEAYCSDPERNGAHAYMAAGFKGTGEVARVESYRLLRMPKIAAAIQAFEQGELQRVRERSGVSLERTLTGIARLASSDVRKLFNQDGSPKRIDELDDDTAMAIEGIEVMEQFEGSGENKVFVGYIKKYKFAQRAAPLNMLMKHLNAYKAHEQAAGVAAANKLVELLSEMRSSALPVVAEVERDSGV